MDNLEIIKKYSDFLIVKLYYNNNGYKSFLYFTNSRVILNSFREKDNIPTATESILTNNTCTIFDLITQKNIIINSADINSYLIEDIDFKKFINLNTITKSDIYYHKKAILEKISALRTNAKQWADSILYIKEFLNKDLFADRMKLEFEENIENFDEYINNLAFIRATSINFNISYICKKFNITEDMFMQATDEQVNSFKQKWAEYINNFTTEFLKYLEAEKSALPQNDTTDYIKEMEVLIEDIKTSISELDFSNANTILKIIAAWPVLLSPPPFFLS